MHERQDRSLGQEDLLGEETATYSNILAWKIPWTEETGGLHFRVTKSLTLLKHFSTHVCNKLREGKGTPLQYSCLENPMSGGAW